MDVTTRAVALVFGALLTLEMLVHAAMAAAVALGAARRGEWIEAAGVGALAACGVAVAAVIVAGVYLAVRVP